MMPEPFVQEVQRCRAAQLDWARRSIRERQRPLRVFRHSLVDAADELTAAVEKDVDRAPGEVLGSDVLPLAEACRFLEKQACRILAPRKVGRAPLFLIGQKDIVYRRPHGIVGIIGTWNYPLYLNGIQIVQALIAGNGVLWKPSEHSMASSKVLHRLLREAGFPKDLVQMLPVEREAGARLLDSEIDFLVFTGSNAVGRQIAMRCAERMIPSTLELSGVDAMFVLEDADVEMAAKAAWFGVTLNRGQTCLAVRRIFVHRNVYDQFWAALRPLVESAPEMRLVMKSQIERAKQFIDDAVSRGGEVLRPLRCDAGALENNSIAPQIIRNATPDMMICTQECFAPIAAVLSFDTIEQALEMESRCPFALGASIFTGNKKMGQELADRLRTGSVCINDVIAPTAHPGTPFGGRYSSGWGTTQGAEGLLAMTVPQVVSTRGGKFRPHYEGTTSALEMLLRGMLAWSHAPSWKQRCRGLWNIVSNVRNVGKSQAESNDPEQKNAGV